MRRMYRETAEFSHLASSSSDGSWQSTQGRRLLLVQQWCPARCPRSQWWSCHHRSLLCPRRSLPRSHTPTGGGTDDFFTFVEHIWFQSGISYAEWWRGRLTLTGNPSLGISRPLGILQVSSFNRTWALQFTPPMVMMIFIHVLTVFSLLCCYKCGTNGLYVKREVEWSTLACMF